mgnify:CR=1 FL=1
MPILQLPSHVVNQIAAGEVVERPASVVKELFENALDAGATSIEVLIEGGGIDRIEVIDDGIGIAPEELPLAVAPHATSKVASVADLEHIATMGFRGEALASIGSVCRLEIRSRPIDSDHGSCIVVDHGEISNVQPMAAPPGTRVVLSGLFARVPARRKFLKSPQAETTRIRRVVRDLAAANPSVATRLVSGGRVLLDWPSSNPEARLVSVLGQEVESNMLTIEASHDGCEVWGRVGTPDLARPTASHQIMCLNGRPIVDRTLRWAIRDAFRGLIEPSRHPTIAIFLGVPPDRVDVNVHPAKTEVRFRDERQVISMVRAAITQALQESGRTPEIRFKPSPSPVRNPGSRPLFGAHDQPRFDTEATRQAMDQPAQPERIPHDPVPHIEAARPVLQVHRMFLVTEDAEGMVIIDQHALHERVMFERLLERVRQGNLPAQRLLVPEVIEVSGDAMEAMDALQSVLARLGFEFTASGAGTLMIHAVPSLLTERGVEVGGFVSDLMSRAADLRDAADEETALRDVLDMMACKAAIKAGQSLSVKECADLLAMREQVERSTHCPHGRPTSLRLSIEELERRFSRR